MVVLNIAAVVFGGHGAPVAASKASRPEHSPPPEECESPHFGLSRLMAPNVRQRLLMAVFSLLARNAFAWTSCGCGEMEKTDRRRTFMVYSNGRFLQRQDPLRRMILRRRRDKPARGWRWQQHVLKGSGEQVIADAEYSRAASTVAAWRAISRTLVVPQPVPARISTSIEICVRTFEQIQEVAIWGNHHACSGGAPVRPGPAKVHRHRYISTAFGPSPSSLTAESRSAQARCEHAVGCPG